MTGVLALMGPTAVGKSGLGLELAERLHGEILNADALQVYRGLDIGTAKPSPEERSRVPHHLLDIVEPSERFSAGEFARLAWSTAAEVSSRGRLPILLGGSGLYLRAALHGLSPIPPTDPAVAEDLARRLEIEGLERLREELAELDAATAGRLRPGDTQRTLRALEVVLSTGRALSSWIKEESGSDEGLEATLIGLTLPRPLLYDRIADRVQRMVQSGWVEEVESLLAAGVESSAPAFQAIGYRQIAEHLRGERTLEEALEHVIRATRRFAKRQMTWFRKEPDVAWFRADEPERALHEILEHWQLQQSLQLQKKSRS